MTTTDPRAFRHLFTEKIDDLVSISARQWEPAGDTIDNVASMDVHTANTSTHIQTDRDHTRTLDTFRVRAAGHLSASNHPILNRCTVSVLSDDGSLISVDLPFTLDRLARVVNQRLADDRRAENEPLLY